MKDKVRRNVTWGGTTVLLVLWLWLSPLGGAEWLNENTGAVTALAAIGSFVATAVIAALTVGTWKLYEIEHRRTQVDQQRWIARITFVSASLDTLVFALSETRGQDRHFTGLAADAMDEAMTVVEAHRRELEGLAARAVDIPAESLAQLDAALIALSMTETFARPLRQPGIDAKRAERNWQEFTSSMEHATAALQRVLNAVPVERRRMGGEGETYEDLLEAAVAPTRQERSGRPETGP